MKLTGGEIIFLEYLTNYNIKIIKDYSAVHENFDSLMLAIMQELKVFERERLNAIDATKLTLEKLKYYKIEAVTIYDDAYPLAIKNINDAPPILYYKGVLKQEPMCAVVGSREVSKYAKKITSELVDWLNELGYGITSGLALGIDTFAHARAVHNKQYTIAVMPNSLESIYPGSNFGLANQILDSGGCLISELPFGINRGNKSFVQRNRLQAALSEVVIPVEMGVKSGTMHTIDFAKRYGKKIYLFKPTPMLSSLDNYQGITYLMNKPHKNQKIFENKESFFQLFETEKSNQDIKLDL